MYRNIYYDNKNQLIHLWTWDENGNRVKYETSYEPYLYIESSTGTDGVSIFNTPLKKRSFKSNFDRKKFVTETPLKIFHNLACEQQFLLDTYKNEVGKLEFGTQPLKVFLFDIETYSKGAFPVPEKAEDPINLITIFDSLSKKYYTWGLKKYTPSDSDVTYFYCKSEYDLIKKFLEFWENDPPDMISGWNSEGFDVPYVVTRIINLMGIEEAARLSPVKNIYYRENAEIDKYGKVINKWIIDGISHIDYMKAYKAFARSDRESYSLGYIGQYELGESKINIGATNLADLSDVDWDKFVDYNIQDVRLLVKLDEKLKYIKLIRTLSYKGFIKFEQSLKKVAMISGAVAYQAAMDGKIIPTFKHNTENEGFEGGYVHEPVRGMANSIVSYDANSLYPNTIITLNVSPETKIGKITHIEGENYHLLLANNRTVVLPKEKFDKLVEKEKLSISKYNVLYTQKLKGVVPKLIDRIYAERVEAKGKMLELQKTLDQIKDKKEQEKTEELILDLDTQQYVYKIVLNSIYGVFGQKHSPLFDIDHAASITLTGQASSKEAADIVMQYTISKGFDFKKDEIYKYGDTDSAYISIQPLLDHYKIKLSEDGKITDEARKIIKELGVFINKGINAWATNELKSIDPRFVFKQEAISNISVFMEKKRYILHLLELDGMVPSKPFKYVGVEVVRSTFSDPIKKLIKQVLESAILAQDKQKANKIFTDAYETVKNMPIEDLSFRTSTSNYEKYERKVDSFGKFGKGITIQGKSSIGFNRMLKQFNLDSKYESIRSGMKIKFFYLAKNRFNFQTMGFIDVFPNELKPVFEIDYKEMFDKTIVPPIDRLYECLGWVVPQVTSARTTDLFELFS